LTVAVADVAARVRLEADLAEATALLHRLLEAEDRIGLVYPVMDDARRFLARVRGKGVTHRRSATVAG